MLSHGLWPPWWINMGTVDHSSAVAKSNDRLVEKFLTAFLGGDGDAVADLVSDDCVLHQPRWPLDTEGKEAIIQATQSNEGMFTDIDIHVERSVATDGDLAAYVTVSGRNVGPVRIENREIAPTGRVFTIPQFGHYRIDDGRITEAWILADALGLVEQLDNLPAGPVKLVKIALRQLMWRLGGRKRLD